ncbi:MAG: lipoate--protein ligase family protein [Gemmataceae bacterium]|nr:lipoate--protein ligase family protein [Gemmataceae bacterium]
MVSLLPATCRLLAYAVADGPHNMAADEVLLESAAAGVASLRCYGWSEATLSLGYFQSERLRHTDVRLAALPYVRRPSGGATLVHHHEVTYALALPAGPPWQTGEPWLRRMHGILADALATLGVTAGLHGADQEEPFTGILCFQHFTPGDLRIGPAKIVGSAQRRQRRALLQHGALLLAASPSAPVLPGIRELTGQDLAVAETCLRVQQAFARHTGWQLVETEWTAAERQRLHELAAGKYRQDSWNRKR